MTMTAEKAWTKASLRELLDRSDAAVMRAIQRLAAIPGGYDKRHDEPMRKFIAMWGRGERLSYKQMKYARSVAKHNWEPLLKIALGLTEIEELTGEAVPLPAAAIMPSVSPDRARYSSLCKCEDMDGERMCDWCEERRFDALIQQQEADEERRRMAHKFGVGSW